MAGLRARGVQLMIDDAGAGFASLRHVLGLHPDAIKLDLSLTRDIDSDPVRRALAASLVAFAREIGATIVAEGIETRGELETLRALGVTHGQGLPSPVLSRARCPSTWSSTPRRRSVESACTTPAPECPHAEGRRGSRPRPGSGAGSDPGSSRLQSSDADRKIVSVPREQRPCEGGVKDDPVPRGALAGPPWRRQLGTAGAVILAGRWSLRLHRGSRTIGALGEPVLPQQSPRAVASRGPKRGPWPRGRATDLAGGPRPSLEVGEPPGSAPTTSCVDESAEQSSPTIPTTRPSGQVRRPRASRTARLDEAPPIGGVVVTGAPSAARSDSPPSWRR